MSPPVGSNGKTTGGVTGKGFKPGHSGNPDGRKKIDPRVKAALEAASLPAALRLVELSKSEDEDIALKASVALLDRVLGKPVQAIDHGASDGAALSFRIERAK